MKILKSKHPTSQGDRWDVLVLLEVLREESLGDEELKYT